MALKEFLEIPVRDDAEEFSTFRRGPNVLRALTAIGISPRGRRVVDLGAGYGSLSIACAEAGAADVLAVDINHERLNAIAERGAAAGLQVRTRQANLLEPWGAAGDADLVFLVGVVEYAGLWDENGDVSDLQTAVFRAAYDALRPGGRLVFGSKNRLWPRFAVKDAHTRQPLVNVLPRDKADQLSLRHSGRPYRHHVQTPQGWANLIGRAGFDAIETYVPYLSYQFPLAIVKTPSFKDIRTARSIPDTAEERAVAWGKAGTVRALIMASAGAVGVQMGSSVMAVAQKPVVAA